MNDLLSNIAGQFEVKVEDASIIKLTVAIMLLIILFFVLKKYI